MLDDRGVQVLIRNRVAMLRGNDYAVHAERPAIAVFHRDLGLAIGAKESDFFVFADFREAMRKVVGELDGHGHQFFGFVAGEAEHEALIAGTAGVHAHGDVWGLPLHGADHTASFGVKAVLGIVVAHLADSVARNLVVVNVCGGGNFARDHH